MIDKLIVKVENSNCSHCGKANTECVVFDRTVMLIFTLKVPICQSCVSKSFRSFKKGE